MVPVRAVSEAFGANVKWDGDTRTVYISTQGKINAFIINADAELTDNDAALMRETLLNNKLLPIDEQNFHTAFEPTRDYFNRIIDALIQQAAENDITYFYYSGHGGSDGSISPTYNHETRNGSFSLTPNELAEILNKIPGTVVVILDSCYSGTITTCDYMNCFMGDGLSKIMLKAHAQEGRGILHNLQKDFPYIFPLGVDFTFHGVIQFETN